MLATVSGNIFNSVVKQKIIMTTISTFKQRASYPDQAIVMIFDLEGFSKFFSQPDVQEYVPKFLNIVLEAVDVCMNGGDKGKIYWIPEDEDDQQKSNQKYSAMPKHIHSKFLGDGALFIWKYNDFTHIQLITLINRLYNLKLNFFKIIEKASDEIPVIDIPKNIRFGIAAGSVYKLTYNNSTKEEFIGYSINLASRLQSYCRNIGFIISGRLNIKATELEDNQYVKKVAKEIKGFPREYVIIDKADYDSLSEEIKSELFE
jgi:class 3 adenylate cyclase